MSTKSVCVCVMELLVNGSQSNGARLVMGDIVGVRISIRMRCVPMREPDSCF